MTRLHQDRTREQPGRGHALRRHGAYLGDLPVQPHQFAGVDGIRGNLEELRVCADQAEGGVYPKPLARFGRR